MLRPVQETSLSQVSCPPGQLFPNTADIFQNDPLPDCIRVGVGTTILDDEGRVLMLAHRESAKCAAGALGPMTETVQWTSQGDTSTPETTLQTIARAVHEELEVAHADSLHLRARRIGGWFLDKVPVGDNYPGQFILAICTVVHMPTEHAKMLVEQFQGQPKNEIERLALMRPDEIAAHRNLRSLAKPILSGVFSRGLHLQPWRRQQVELRLPAVQQLVNASDNIPVRPLVA